MKSPSVPDYYQIKFKFSGADNYIYGIVDRFSKEARERYKKNKHLLVSDALTSKRYWVDEKEVTRIHIAPTNEYSTYVDKAYKKAQKLSDSVKGVAPGKLFSIGVADGVAYYLVTEVDEERGLAKVEWRGFCLDRYTDYWLGWGDWVSISKVAPLCGRWKL